MGKLADQNNGEPDWRFDEREHLDHQAARQLFIARTLLNMHARTPGILSASMLPKAQQEGQ